MKGSGTNLSLQLANDAAGEEKRGGGTYGANELLIWGKWKKVEIRRGKGKRRGRWFVPALGGADGGEGWVRALPVGPIYRVARSVSRR